MGDLEKEKDNTKEKEGVHSWKTVSSASSTSGSPAATAADQGATAAAAPVKAVFQNY
jgi:hypothetical protein